ncbi:Beta-xylosidase [Mucilaginibacter sp. OK268]|uniref:glycoside hydrolase family 43 protein n=1 Tax=Mucilaginibacter sp. OK268 TaxID=1881048 RepID=UPI00088ACCB8|nr:glycoside hydrolase 43 family protein [Mucilaginibacter sp. OK268]SDP12465.1 Beta-xylosidase [Mucilaginibacter sp. OK268]
MKNTICILAFAAAIPFANAQVKPVAKSNYRSKVWVADQGNGTYKNPVLNADYSDPDAIRVGDDFYLVSSSFEDIPGLPVLYSKDLVNWRIIGHALLRQPPFDHFDIPRHGDGVWAPALRYYKGEFYLYYPDPDYGIYLIKAKNAAGSWSNPVMVYAGKGLIDPCPLMDDDGQMYLVHGFAGSRAGIKSVIAVNKLNADGTKVTDTGVIVYDGHETDPTIEGPKFYKRNGYYYIFAPAGGVPAGWQLVLRSKNIYGPYERKVVMDQGKTTVNGPHQGAWVTTQTGEDWFLHFQDKEQYGRVVHLQPMVWKNNWPVIGTDKDGDGKGEPVMVYKKPNVGKTYPIETPVESDEFNGTTLGLQWQWMANAQASWYYMNPGKGALRLYSGKMPEGAKNLWGAGNVLLQKFMADEFAATTKMTFTPNVKLEEKAGLAIMGFSYAGIAVKNKKDGVYLVFDHCKDADKGNAEEEKTIAKLDKPTVWLRVKVSAGAKCDFSYSTDGQTFINVGETFHAEVGRWIGAKVGIFCMRDTQINDSGYADFDWFRVTPIDK